MTGIIFLLRAIHQFYTIKLIVKAMKTILLTTDFSNSASDAARYGYNMARQIKANVVLCNAIIVPAEIPQAGMVTWQTTEYDVLIDDSANELNRFKNELEQSAEGTGFKPKIKCTCEAGVVTEVLRNAAATEETDMIVIGSHKGGSLSRLFLGDHADLLIDSTTKPLLMVSPGTEFKRIKKIAFATDFKTLETDLKIIYELITWAKLLDAEILLTHVVHDKEATESLQKSLSECLLELSNKANYPHIYYRLIKNNRFEDGIDWLCEHGQVDMLAMVHRSRNFFAELFGTSHTKKVAGHLHLPLLVFPA
jgi:nucleotide-binding universal stress UspA family protein